MNYNILVTGIGGNVGQGILRNLSALNYDLRLIGTNTVFLSAGNHLCDKVFQIPFAYATDYISSIKSICETENIHLIIPSTDYECYYLSIDENRKILPPVATSPEKTNAVFLDKYMTWKCFCENNISFAESSLPSQYHDNFEATVVKPREGRGSKNVFFDPKNLKGFDDTYVIQKKYSGQEITTAFYVTVNNELHGSITFARELFAGTTNMCEVTHTFDDKVLKIIHAMMSCIEIRGSCNIQSIVTESQEIIPFEINGRISGTNSIRSQFGFKDIQYTVEEYLLHKKPEPVVIAQGSAVRILLDVIYPDTGLAEIKDRSNTHYIF